MMTSSAEISRSGAQAPKENMSGATVGKTADGENFPVGSRLLPARLRPHVAVFYAFARAADDIADSGELSAAEKLEQLNLFEAAVTSGDSGETPMRDLAKATTLHKSLADSAVSERHALDLLAAFKQDAVKNRYANWGELMDYCELSANPVGRYLLDLHDDPASSYPASDGLCSALQVLNHLQDIKDDCATLDRVYLPGDWMAQEGVTIADLTAGKASPGLRRVIDRCLDATDMLIEQAAPLALILADGRLAMESAAIVRLARRLSRKLRARDPIAERVAFSKVQLIGNLLIAAGALPLRRMMFGRKRDMTGKEI